MPKKEKLDKKISEETLDDYEPDRLL